MRGGGHNTQSGYPLRWPGGPLLSVRQPGRPSSLAVHGVLSRTGKMIWNWEIGSTVLLSCRAGAWPCPPGCPDSVPLSGWAMRAGLEQQMGPLYPERPRPWPQREAEGPASVSLLSTGPGSIQVSEASLCADPSWAGSALSLGVPTGMMSCDNADGRAQQGENGALAGSGPEHPCPCSCVCAHLPWGLCACSRGSEGTAGLQEWGGA